MERDLGDDPSFFLWKRNVLIQRGRIPLINSLRQSVKYPATLGSLLHPRNFVVAYEEAVKNGDGRWFAILKRGFHIVHVSLLESVPYLSLFIHRPRPVNVAV